MDFVSMAQVLLRRFYVFVPMVLLVVVATLLYGHSIEPTYQYSESLLLLGPNSPNSSDQPSVPFNNPWFQVDKSLTSIESLVVDAMNSPDVDTGVKAGTGVTATFTGGGNPNIPVVNVNTSSKSRSAAEAALQPAVDAFKANLRMWQKQTGATDNALVTTLPTPGGVNATVLYPGKTRGEAAIVAVGLVISLILTFVAESVIVRRRSRGSTAHHHESHGTGHPLEPDTSEEAESVHVEF